MDIETLQALSGVCSAISRLGFVAAVCFCLWQGHPRFAIGFMVLSFTGGISVGIGGRR